MELTWQPVMLRRPRVDILIFPVGGHPQESKINFRLKWKEKANLPRKSECGRACVCSVLPGWGGMVMEHIGILMEVRLGSC